MQVFFSFVHQIFLKKMSVYTKKLKKNIFQQQISILEWFLKDHVTLKTGVMLKIQLCTTWINYIWKYIDRKHYFFNCINNLQYYCFTVFWSNKCSLGENKRLISVTLKKFTDPKLLNGFANKYFFIFSNSCLKQVNSKW